MRDFSSNFYEAKRWALLSSVLLLFLSATGVSISPDAKVFIFEVGKSDFRYMFVIICLVWLYYNFQYFFTLYSEFVYVRRSESDVISKYETLLNDLSSSLSLYKTHAESVQNSTSRISSVLESEGREIIGFQLSLVSDTVSSEVRSRIISGAQSVKDQLFGGLDSVYGESGVPDRNSLEGRQKISDVANIIGKEIDDSIIRIASQLSEVVGRQLYEKQSLVISGIEKSITALAVDSRDLDAKMVSARRMIRGLKRDIFSWKFASNSRIYVFDVFIPVGLSIVAVGSIVSIVGGLS